MKFSAQVSEIKCTRAVGIFDFSPPPSKSSDRVYASRVHRGALSSKASFARAAILHSRRSRLKEGFPLFLPLLSLPPRPSTGMRPEKRTGLKIRRRNLCNSRLGNLLSCRPPPSRRIDPRSFVDRSSTARRRVSRSDFNPGSTISTCAREQSVRAIAIPRVSNIFPSLGERSRSGNDRAVRHTISVSSPSGE